MTAMERRVEALELATGGTEADAEDLAIQQMSDEELEGRARAILSEHDPPAADDMSEDAVLERKVRELMARRDAQSAK